MYVSGSPFDMTQGLWAGPFNNPNRVEGGPGLEATGAQFPRAISLMRTAYAVIHHPDPENPVVWFASDSPATSVFVPFLAKTLKEANLLNNPDQVLDLYSEYYQRGSKNEVDFSSAWWNFNLVANWMSLNYKNMSELYVYPAVQKWQMIMDSSSTITAKKSQNVVVENWKTLLDLLFVRYSDGYFNFPPEAPNQTLYTGYPEWYLRDLGIG
jgi:dipeptidase